MSSEPSFYPRVLIISHPVLSRNTSAGKTLDTFFSGWPREKIAQFYVQSEVPTNPLCVRYFRFTDPDALKSIVLRRHKGRALGEEDVCPQRLNPVDMGSLTGVYNFGRRRTPGIYLARDALWRLSAWKHSGLLPWAESFRPEVIFYASGDYAFSYRITRFLSQRLNIPYVVCCFDDFYLFNPNQGRFLGSFRHRLFMKTVRETLAASSKILTVNEEMSEAYSRLFGRACGVVYTAARTAASPPPESREGVVYLGDLGFGRASQLSDLASALRDCAAPGVPQFLDVWSAETDPENLKPLRANPAVRYHGFVSGEKVPEIIRSAKAVVHTESFDPVVRQQIRFSLSTKIPDCLASGTALLAYGPAEAASLAYLRRYDAAFSAASPEELRRVLPRLFGDPAEYRRVVENAQTLAQSNHTPVRTRETVRSALAFAAAGNRE